MIENSLTLKDARALCVAHQHLVGSTVVSDKGNLKIECVTISPMDDINKHIFLERYKDYKNPDRAIEFYSVPFYDVLMLAKDKNDTLHYFNLRNHLGTMLPGN